MGFSILLKINLVSYQILFAKILFPATVIVSFLACKLPTLEWSLFLFIQNLFIRFQNIGG
jgi:hypothetical protein